MFRLKAFSCFLGLAACLSAADPSLLKLAMPDARVAAGLNVDQARASKLGQHILSKMEAGDEDFQRFVAMTGFDPRRDLREVLVVSPAGKTNRKLVVARGVFDRGKLEAAARAHGAQAIAHKGVSLWSDPKGNTSDAFAIVDETLAMAGDADSLRQAIDRSAGAARTALNPAMAGEIAKVSGLYDAWFVSLVPASEIAGHVPDQRVNGALQGDAFKGIRQASGGVSLRQDPVQFSAEVISATEQDAASLAGALQFLAGLARMGEQQPSSALNAATSTLSVVAKGNVVNVAFSVPEQILETAPQVRPRHRRVAPVVHRRAQ